MSQGTTGGSLQASTIQVSSFLNHRADRFFRHIEIVTLQSKKPPKKHCLIDIIAGINLLHCVAMIGVLSLL